MPITGSPLTTNAQDLVSSAYVLQCLPTLTAAQQVFLPQAISEASELIQRWCKRLFNQQTYDELYDSDGQSVLMLRQYPVSRIIRVATWPTVVFQVKNSDTANTSEASIEIATSGDWTGGLTVTGVNLNSTTLGVDTTHLIPLTGNPTITTLVAAINAYGNNWSATVVGNWGNQASSRLLPVQGSNSCLGSYAGLKIHTTYLASHVDDAEAGIIRLDPGVYDPVFGLVGAGSIGGLAGTSAFALGPNAIRVTYVAGFAPVPLGVQQATVETIKAAYERLGTDTTLLSERGGEYSWTGRQLVLALPEPVMQALSPYRNFQVGTLQA